MGLVAVHVAAGMVDDHRHAALLDERKDVAVAVAADLVQVGQERLGEVEVGNKRDLVLAAAEPSR